MFEDFVVTKTISKFTNTLFGFFIAGCSCPWNSFCCLYCTDVLQRMCHGTQYVVCGKGTYMTVVESEGACAQIWDLPPLSHVTPSSYPVTLNCFFGVESG